MSAEISRGGDDPLFWVVYKRWDLRQDGPETRVTRECTHKNEASSIMADWDVTLLQESCGKNGIYMPVRGQQDSNTDRVGGI